jgi:orotate phosphoribosyltransferase
MNQWEILEIFQKEGAVLKGHFLLSSGLHSDTYIQCAKVLQFPRLAQSLGDELARRFSEEKIDLVLSPALGGVIIGYMVAIAIGKRMLFAERSEGRMLLRRGQAIEKGERALVVEDVITTGGSVRELIGLSEAAGAMITGVGALIERGEVRDLGVLKRVLLPIDVMAWEEDNCPLCREEVPIVAPGSRRQGS